MMHNCEMFTLRVYGILVNGLNILLTDEFRMGRRMTKFPGGGLHYGEGTLDCLRREFLEEIGQEPYHIVHLYTTDYFQPTELVVPPRQLISIYYSAEVATPDAIPVTDKLFDFEDVEGAQTFRWISLFDLTPDDLTFPIDKKVAAMISRKKSVK